jgi:hypothetical protein
LCRERPCAKEKPKAYKCVAGANIHFIITIGDVRNGVVD